MDELALNPNSALWEGSDAEAVADQDGQPQTPQGLPEQGTAKLDEEPQEVSSEAGIEQLRQTVLEGFEQILKEFQEKLTFDRFKEKQIAHLHDEVQSHRRDLLGQAVRPLIQGIIRLHDDLQRMTGALQERPTEDLTPERFFQAFEGFAEDIELLLGQHGIEPFRMPGEDFDPRRQTAVLTVGCGEKEIAGRIAKRLRPGFMQGETLLQKERVAVYAFTAE